MRGRLTRLLDGLEPLLATVPAGPWHTGKGDHYGREVRNQAHVGVAWCGNIPDGTIWAKYIAALSPDVVGELIRMGRAFLDPTGVGSPTYIYDVRTQHFPGTIPQRWEVVRVPKSGERKRVQVILANNILTRKDALIVMAAFKVRDALDERSKDELEEAHG